MIIITGHIQQGKTTFLSGVLDRLSEEGIRMAGFLSLGSYESGKRSAFTLRDVNSGDRMEMAAGSWRKDWYARGPFWFNPAAIEWGTHLITMGIEDGARLFILDEIGPLELEGRAWAPLLDKLLAEERGLLLLVVRSSILQEVLDKWGIIDPVVVEALPGEEKNCIRKIKEYVR
jgi:nucleoside-triphosphatase THEP1